MKKLLKLTVLCILFSGVYTGSCGQADSATISAEPSDTISIDNMEPVYYEEETVKESSNTLIYAIVGGILVVGGATLLLRWKKK